MCSFILDNISSKSKHALPIDRTFGDPYMAEDSSISLESHKNSNEVKAGDDMVVTSFEDEDSCKYGELILLGFVVFFFSVKKTCLFATFAWRK